MSGVKVEGIRNRVPDNSVMCLLSCANPPGKPLQLWYCELPLPSMQTETDNDVMSSLRNLLQYLYPEGGEE